MPVEFTAAQVRAIAQLAQLDLTDGEVALFARQLGEFLGYAADVLAIDTRDVTPTAYVLTRPASDRADETRPSLDRADALGAAPDAALDAGFFKVPRVIG
jgi:aspartyl-tRNA(Asn)/glutamyl-tRNA(Gln) amidotransferase subunit C